MINKGPGKKSPKQLYAEENVLLIPASNDTDFFLGLFLQLLRKRKPDGSPCFHINIDRCPHLTNQIKQAAWDSTTITGSTHDKMKVMENHALDSFKYYLNGAGLNASALNPVVPGKSAKGHQVRGEWEHDSYWDDLDFDSEDYAYPSFKEVE